VDIETVTERHNLVRRALVRGRAVNWVGAMRAGIVDRIFVRYPGGRYRQREDREAFLVEPAHARVLTFG
jgi:hypothetical protein